MTSMRDAFREELIRAMPNELVEWRGRAGIERDVEERLDRELAPAAQRRLVERLANSHSDAVLWGTIDRRDEASRATAERIGRHSVAAWHWLMRP